MATIEILNNDPSVNLIPKTVKNGEKCIVFIN